MKDGKRVISEPKAVASKFKKFFTTMGCRIAQKLQSVPYRGKPGRNTNLLSKTMVKIYRKFLLAPPPPPPPGGNINLKTHLRRLAKTVLSALHKKLEGEVKKLRLEKKKELEVLQPRINNKSELPTRE